MHLDELTVAAGDWHPCCARLVAEGARMLDFLTAVDRPAEGRIEVVAHLVDVPARRRFLVRTEVDRGSPVLRSLVDVCPGAAWHEREVHEMFGVDFAGNDDLRHLLIAADDYPLRRTTPLPRRVATAWPGAHDPADQPAPPPADTRPPTSQNAADVPAAPAAVRPGARVAARPRSRPPAPGVHPEWLS